MRISDYLIRPTSTSTEPSGQYNLQLEAYNLAVNALNRMTSPKVDNATTDDAVLDKIRAEIADLDDAEYEFEGYYKAVNDALQIIDKYREEQIDAT